MEKFDIKVTKDKQKAMLSFSNTNEAITKDEVLLALRNLKIVYGIKEDTIEQALEERNLYGEYLVAAGKEPTVPYAGKVEYFFRQTKDVKPSMGADGTVDYKNLSLISNVKQGELLAKLDPAVEGEEGTNIYGDSVSPAQVKPAYIKGGKNTVFSDDKTELYAFKDGMVMLQDGAVMVYDIYQVPNNVGTSTGNIEFEGTVIVTGNVLTGFEVIANGDIEVYGVVEGAVLKAKGNILLHRGVSGMGRAVIEADGDLMTKYIEQSSVFVKGNIHAGAILHSDVRCSGSVVVEGRKSLISGGKIVSGSYVETSTLGSNMGTFTEIEVGANPVIVEEYQDLQKRLPKLKNEIEQLEKVVLLLNKRKEIAGKLEEDKQEMYASAIKNKIVLQANYLTLEKKYQKLESDLANSTVGEIRITGVAHSGVRLMINNVSRILADDVRAVRFHKDGADLKMMPIY